MDRFVKYFTTPAASPRSRSAAPVDPQLCPDRRTFLKHAGWLTAAGSGILGGPARGSASEKHALAEDPMGVLVDLTACIGCRLCEYACRQANGITTGALESYDDTSVFKEQRRPASDAFTVVNAFNPTDENGGDDDGRPVYAKINCMHCNDPACVSACLVGAMEKQPNGAVTYDAWKCIGCRYCMVACPFQLPAYSYEDVLTPQVRKCQLCFASRTSRDDTTPPACVEACPRQAMKWGRRRTLLGIAHERIDAQPERYVNHVYGEHEVGGTSWMYLSPVPFEQAGFLPLGTSAPPRLTEAIQHGVFKYWIAPLGWYGLLATVYWWTGRAHRPVQAGMPSAPETGAPEASAPLLAVPAYSGLKDTPAPLSHEREQPAPSGSSRALHKAETADELKTDHFAPAARKLLTPGVWALIAAVLTGVGFGLYRFIVGLGASTNLDQQHPWGLWIAMDVGSGIALAGGGFVSAAVIHIFHRHRYHALARSALLTALLGYTFYVPGLLADIGRWYNIWHPTLPSMWQGNSVLFEVGICVMIYLNVQYLELTPIVCQRLLGDGWMQRRPRLHRLTLLVHDLLEKMMPAFLVLGVALSTFHQSSLGNLMVIAPSKLHPLWWTPLSPLLFLLSAMMVGFPMVIFTILFASWSLRREPEMDVLGRLARRYAPVFLAAYLLVKVGDMLWRGTYVHLADGGLLGMLWVIEVMVGVIAPLAMLASDRITRSPRLLGLTCLMVIVGVVLNRLNVFVIAYHPPYAARPYIPSLTEFMVSMGLIAALLLTYRVAVTYLPILEPRAGRVA